MSLFSLQETLLLGKDDVLSDGDSEDLSDSEESVYSGLESSGSESSDEEAEGSVEEDTLEHGKTRTLNVKNSRPRKALNQSEQSGPSAQSNEYEHDSSDEE
ncbi:Hypothetical predicted protein, partial [Pelobates cultripes]